MAEGRAISQTFLTFVLASTQALQATEVLPVGESVPVVIRMTKISLQEAYVSPYCISVVF